MALNLSPIMQEEIREVLSRALMTARGIRINFSSHGQAKRFRDRVYIFRKRERDKNIKLGILDGQSEYDGLSARLDGVSVIISPADISNLDIEEL